MKKILLLTSLFMGLINANEIKQPKIEVTEAGIKYALNKNYSQLMKYSLLSDKCFRALSENKTNDLERCENYQQITKDIQARIERLEDLKRRYYKK